MSRIIFVTGNDRKAWQAKEALKPFDISVEVQNHDIDEIQSHDAAKIGVAKARAAFDIVREPLVVNDHFWSINALNGFPGGYMKDVHDWFEAQDFINLIKDKADKSVVLTEHVVYFDGATLRQFSVQFPGTMITRARGKGEVSLEQVVVFDGTDKTIAEHIDAGEHARDVHMSAWHSFGEWFSKQK